MRTLVKFQREELYVSNWNLGKLIWQKYKDNWAGSKKNYWKISPTFKPEVKEAEFQLEKRPQKTKTSPVSISNIWHLVVCSDSEKWKSNYHLWDLILSHFEMTESVNRNIYLNMFPYDEVAGLGKKYSMFYVDSFHWGCSMGNKQESFHKKFGHGHLEVGNEIKVLNIYFQFSSVQSLSRVWLFATPWTAACQASLSITNSRSLLKLMSIESVMPSSYLVLCRPLLLLPPISPSTRVFYKSTFHMRWPKYWSFSFSINPSNEHPELISFRMDWLDLAVQGTLKSLLQHHSSKASILQHSAFFIVQLSHP